MSDELDRILATEESSLAKDKEIARVLECCAGDYFAVFEINPLCDPENIDGKIKKVYRKKTLLLHPDKVQNPRAPQAFDRLKKAEIVLSQVVPDDEARKDLDDATKAIVTEKQNLINIYRSVAQQLGLPVVEYFHDEANQRIRVSVASVLEEQTKQGQVEKQYQQRQETQRNEEIKRLQKERELKKQLASKWEDDRDHRVNNWRNYTNKVDKHKKKKKGSTKKLLA